MEHSHKSIFSDETLYAPKTPPMRVPPPERPAEQAAKRRYEVFYLDRQGQLRDTTLMAASHAAFEQAFSVIKQGSIVQTEQGHTSVEDVYPGDRVRLDCGTLETVQWRGSITINPFDMAANKAVNELTRITADALGYNRPMPDLVLGHGARILHRAAGIRRLNGKDAAFIPAADFIDGNHTLCLRPMAPMTMYQFGFHGQRSLAVNGVAVETLHPGTAFNLGLRGDSLRAFMALFPHKSSFEDFGLLHIPRLRLRDLELLG